MGEIEQFGMIRHGAKQKGGEIRKPLEESGLSKEQQRKWSEAVEALKLVDPELSHETVPGIEKLARHIYDGLPKHALVIFVSTDTPRTKLTADLLSMEILEIENSGGNKKDVAVAFIWEPEEIKKQPNSLSNIPIWPPEIMKTMREIIMQDARDDEVMEAYLKSDGNFEIPNENGIMFRAINNDLSNEESSLKRRAEELMIQYEKLKNTFVNEKRPIFFYGLGHHSSLVALDIAFNGREEYISVDEIPNPLDLWHAKKQ
ncbi:MAG: hypothetical protein PHP25_00245 [Candidatus Moranbacteria bacterium]|nr:hypothetical protein [Candidatus Moranbacteria bacterium]